MRARRRFKLSFTPIRFTPKERQYAGKECGGVFIAITDRDAFEPVRLGVMRFIKASLVLSSTAQR